MRYRTKHATRFLIGAALAVALATVATAKDERPVSRPASSRATAVRHAAPAQSAPTVAVHPRQPAGSTVHRDADRDRVTQRPSGRIGHGGVPRFRPYSPYWGGWWWGWGPWGVPYYFDFPLYHSYTVVYPNQRFGDYGALDLDVSPEKAQVFVNGDYVGVADQYDGHPDYLWLQKGTYDLVFYMPGFETIARQYSIYPGLVIDVEDRMTRGEAVRPEDLPSTSTAHRDARLGRDAERQVEAEAAEGRGAAAVGPGEQAGRLRLTVAPADASVYLDGRFLGTGDELSRLHAGLIISVGGHRLEAVRPGFVSEARDFDVAPDEQVTLDLQLAPAGG